MNAGVFIALYDENTLNLYLKHGVYGFLMAPTRGVVNSRSKHYNALADYACMRKGTEVFFFLNRRIVYGGKIVGSNEHGAFLLNGTDSPLCISAKSPLCWDEAVRAGYGTTEESGIFTVPDVGERCQPYFIRFEDKLDLKGKYISSDDLYWKLGDYTYPLPSNAMQNMGFCSLTPGETKTALDLITNYPKGQFPATNDEPVYLKDGAKAFKPEFGILNLGEAYHSGILQSEAQMEFSILANPQLVPAEIRPQSTHRICRQIPISPFKPAQMDRADICYYDIEDPIRDGTIPNVLIELKFAPANKNSIWQVERYLEWLHRVVGEDADRVKAYLVGFEFRKNIQIEKYKDQIKMVRLIEDKKNKELMLPTMEE